MALKLPFFYLRILEQNVAESPSVCLELFAWDIEKKF